VAVEHEGKIVKISTKQDKLGILVATVQIDIELNEPTQGNDLLELQAGGNVFVALRQKEYLKAAGKRAESGW